MHDVTTKIWVLALNHFTGQLTVIRHSNFFLDNGQNNSNSRQQRAAQHVAQSTEGTREGREAAEAAEGIREGSSRHWAVGQRGWIDNNAGHESLTESLLFDIQRLTAYTAD
jgi:hypothetical protein